MKIRDVKFRAWDISKKEWSKDCVIALTGHLEYTERPNDKLKAYLKEYDEMADYSLIDWTNWYAIENFTIMQYTGLKDKNKKEIYEGDILLIPDTYKNVILDDGSGPEEDFDHLVPVVFKEGAFGIDIQDSGELLKKGFVPFSMVEYTTGDTPDMYEIVGNMYENDNLVIEKADERFKKMSFGELLIMKEQVERCYNEATDKEFLEGLKKEIEERSK